MMKTKYLAAVSALLLAGCVYSETPYGRYAAIDLPVESRTTINKTVTINAPPGTTVVYGDATSASAYQGGYDCYYDRANRRRCYPRHNPPPRQVYRVEGQSGSIGQTYEGGGYYIGGQISR